MKIRKAFRKKLKGLSLMEILVVLLIIGILTNLVLPRLLPTITKAKTMEAKLQLSHLHNLQKSFFFENSRYASNLNEVGFEQERLAIAGGRANYRLSITKAGADRFSAQAIAVIDFDNDGQLNCWEIDQDRNIIERTAD